MAEGLSCEAGKELHTKTRTEMLQSLRRRVKTKQFLIRLCFVFSHALSMNYAVITKKN